MEVVIADRRSWQLGVLLILVSTAAWSTAGFFTRLIDLDVWTMLAWRGLFGAAGLFAVIAVTDRGNFWASLRRTGPSDWLFVAISAVGMIFFITSLRHTTVAHVAIIYATVPLVAAGLGWLVLGERPGRAAMVASMAALIGVAVTVGLGFEGRLSGDLLAAMMTLAMAAMMVIARRGRGLSVMPAAALSALVSGLVCWPLGDPLDVSGHDLLLLACFGLANSAIGLTLFVYGARLLPPVETALIGTLETPLAPLWVLIAFGESPGMSTVAGGLVVFIAVVWYIAVSARAARRIRQTVMDC
ncbi:MAG: DMT family transporter [Rhodobiaceae bacterium]|nr:DMT family transporter [Rhodobiaceae bacterium]